MNFDNCIESRQNSGEHGVVPVWGSEMHTTVCYINWSYSESNSLLHGFNLVLSWLLLKKNFCASLSLGPVKISIDFEHSVAAWQEEVLPFQTKLSG